MRRTALPFALPLVLLALFVLPLSGCGGGGGGGTPVSPSPLTTEQLLEQCVTGDLGDLGTLLGTIQGVIDSASSGGPQPEFNLLAALLTGVLPWTLDLDADQVDDLSGTIFLTDAGGGVTRPQELLTLLGGGGVDLEQALALLPDGTSIHLTFDFDDVALFGGATGDGELAVETSGGTAAGTSGSGTFTSGACGFDFTFEGLAPEALDGSGFGTGAIGFEVTAGPDTVAGSIEFDGTDTARITARRNGGPEEIFLVDLATGDVTPG